MNRSSEDKRSQLYFVAGGLAVPNGQIVSSSEEFADIRRIFDQYFTQGNFDVPLATFPTTFADLIHELSLRCPTHVHFSGHGQERRLLLVREQRQVLVNHPISDNDVLTIFRSLDASGHKVELAFFNTCHSSGLAKKLVGTVRYAIGTAKELSDTIAREFARLFYRSLALGHTIPNAYKLARAGIPGYEAHEKAGGLPRLFGPPSSGRRGGGCPFGAAPAGPGRFVGREALLHAIFQVLEKDDPIFLSGDPQIGKSSVLLMIGDSDIQRDYLRDLATHWITVRMDMHGIDASFGPREFWQGALRCLVGRGIPADVVAAYGEAQNEAFSTGSVTTLLEYLARSGRRILLLVDEFDVLGDHEAFGHVFWESLRSIPQTSKGVTLVVASRLSRAEMQSRLRSRGQRGSESLNVMTVFRLEPFSDADCEALLRRGGVRLTTAQRCYIRRLAGPLPGILQTAAQRLWLSKTLSIEQHAEAVLESSEEFFDSLFQIFDPDLRAAALLLGLAELGRRDPACVKPLEPQALIALAAVDGLSVHGLTGSLCVGGKATEALTLPLVFAWWVRRSGYRHVDLQGRNPDVVEKKGSAPETATSAVAHPSFIGGPGWAIVADVVRKLRFQAGIAPDAWARDVFAAAEGSE